jgi:hypothetical protein
MLGGIATMLLARYENLRNRWLTPILYGVCAATVLMLFIAALHVVAYVRSQSAFDVADVEAAVEDWSLGVGWSVKKQADPAWDFGYEVTTNNTPVNVYREKATDRHLMLRSILTLTGDHPAMFKKLPPDKADALVRELRIEMTRMHMDYANIRNPLQAIVISQRMPVTRDLTAEAYVTAVREMQDAVILARQLINLRLGGD